MLTVLAQGPMWIIADFTVGTCPSISLSLDTDHILEASILCLGNGYGRFWVLLWDWICSRFNEYFSKFNQGPIYAFYKSTDNSICVKHICIGFHI